MLTQCSDDISAFFGASRILQQLIDNALLELPATRALSICYFDKGLIHSFDSKWFRFSERKALFLFRLESNISCVPNLVIERFEGLAI